MPRAPASLAYCEGEKVNALAAVVCAAAPRTAMAKTNKVRTARSERDDMLSPSGKQFRDQRHDRCANNGTWSGTCKASDEAERSSCGQIGREFRDLAEWQ